VYPVDIELLKPLKRLVQPDPGVNGVASSSFSEKVTDVCPELLSVLV
jgi:hypothetical protein